jgi:hypothetical protein
MLNSIVLKKYALLFCSVLIVCRLSCVSAIWVFAHSPQEQTCHEQKKSESKSPEQSRCCETQFIASKNFEAPNSIFNLQNTIQISDFALDKDSKNLHILFSENSIHAESPPPLVLRI